MGAITPEMMFQTIQGFHDKIDQGFNRVYDVMHENKKELSEELAAVSDCVDGHQKACATRFTSIETKQREHGTSLFTLQEDKKERFRARNDWGKWIIRACLAVLVAWAVTQALEKYFS